MLKTVLLLNIFVEYFVGFTRTPLWSFAYLAKLPIH